MNTESNESKLIRWIIFLPILGVLFTSFILTNIFISSKKESLSLEIENIKKTHILNLKNILQERIDYIAILLNNKYTQQLNDAKKSIQDKTTIADGFLNTIYENNKHLRKEELYKKIDESMREIGFFKDKKGYYFIYDLTEGTFISIPSDPSLIKTSLKQLSDKEGKSLFNRFENVLSQSHEGFYEWYGNESKNKKKRKKIGYIKKFEPLNIVFGTVIYMDGIQEDIKKNLEEFLRSLQYKDNSYIFVMNTKGTAIIHKNQSIIGVEIAKLEKELQQNVKKIVQKATQSKGAFLEYKQSSQLFENFKQSKKISYVKHVPILDWIIGTGLYTNDLNQQVELKEKRLEKNLEEDIKTILIVSLLVTTLIVLFFIFISIKLKNIFHFYSKQIDKKHKELKTLNEDLEEKIKSQVKINRDKDKLLYQQSKMASMGEMLGNIAHQWRQPLSSISAAASGILIQKNFGKLTDEHMEASLKNIVKNTKVLSQTIDDFRNFYKTEKTKKKFKINDLIEKVLMLIDANLKNNEITIVKEIDDIEIYGLENELIQAILNIINNARDILIELPPQDKRYIFINISREQNGLIIKIKDNAGGIKEESIYKIFEPYFTTKHKSQGTGIGLYMTHEIITENLGGTIEVENSTYVYENSNYTGALFSIKLPLEDS